ncbi:MAG: ABC transporter permease [Defluviitaleaceae bacterium]|nr:ABC transporter permease [Defluviitaleaceae bacterium]
MTALFALTKRNLLIFFKDKAAVFFSLLSVLIIILLYVMFLGNVMMSGNQDTPGFRFMMDSWIMAGLIAVASVSSTMGAFGTMVDDRTRKILKDFSVAPMSRTYLTGGYVLSAYLVGVIMSAISLVFAQIYIIAYGGDFLSTSALLRAFGVILLSAFASSSMMFFLVSLFKSQNAFSAASAIIGTLIGFLTGIYVPIGNLPDVMQFVVKIFPISHAGALLRQIMMEEPMQVVFEGAPVQAVSEFSESLGVVFSFNGNEVSVLSSVLILVATGIFFYVLAVFNMSRKKSEA